VALLHVVDQLHDDDGLADAGAAEEADLAALHERRDQVDDLDAGLEDRGLGLEVDELRGLPVDRPALVVGRDRRPAVHRLAQDVENPAQGRVAHRHRDRPARSSACMPRFTPSVELMATARTWFWPMCCCTSATRRTLSGPLESSTRRAE
jgi:hypothetical protein